MNAQQVIEWAASRGVQIARGRGTRIRLAPSQTVTDEVRSLVRAHRTALLAHLDQPTFTADARGHDPQTRQRAPDKTDRKEVNGGFVSSVSTGPGASEKKHPTGPPSPFTAEDRAAIREGIEERAAIQEFDGGLSRHQAEQEARAAIEVYRFRLTDNPDRWLTLITPGTDLKQARHSLSQRFGADRFIEAQPARRDAVLTAASNPNPESTERLRNV